MDFGWISACPPADYEPASAIILGLSGLVNCSPKVLVDVVGAMAGHIPLVGIVLSERQREDAIIMLNDWGIPSHHMRFVSMPVGGIWIRDYGPSFVRWSDGAVTIVAGDYRLTDRPNDAVVPLALAGLLRVPRLQAPLTVEGGNLLSNGQGLAAFTTALLDRNAHRNLSSQALQQILWDFYGLGQLATLVPVPSIHAYHADLFMAFASPETALVSEYDRSIDPAAADILDQNAKILSQVRTRGGRMQVVRIPMPAAVNGLCRSYTNVMHANGRLLVPRFSDVGREVEQAAYRTWSQLFPSSSLIPVDCDELVPKGGYLRCMSLQVPWLPDRFPSRSSRRSECSSRWSGLAGPSESASRAADQKPISDGWGVVDLEKMPPPAARVDPSAMTGSAGSTER